MIKLLIAACLLGVVVSTRQTRAEGRDMVAPYAFWCGVATVSIVAVFAVSIMFR